MVATSQYDPRMRPGLPVLFVCGEALACTASSRSVTTRLPDAPTLDGRPVYARALDDSASRFWSDAMSQREDRPPAVSPDAGMSHVRHTLAPWLRRRADALMALARAVPLLDRRSADDAVFAAVVYATVAGELYEDVRSLPPPTSLTSDAVATWNEIRAAQALPLARHARTAWARCSEAVGAASPPLRAWADACAAHVQSLDALLAHAPSERVSPPQTASPLATAPRRAPSIPTECEGPELRAFAPDPDAPPPDDRRPREVALVYDDTRFVGADRARFVTALRQWVSSLADVRLVPQPEVAAAEALRAQRRWHVGGAVCGQAPPLPALLAVRHPNLVMATARTWCGTVDDETPRDGGSNTQSYCTLTVSFERAGTNDRSELPPQRSVDVRAPTTRVESWISAVATLSDPDAGTAMRGLMGGPGVSDAPFYRVLGYSELDPWLRVAPTLLAWGAETPREAIGACASREGGVGAYRVAFKISASGRALDVQVTPTTPPTDGSVDRVATCVREVIARTPFPCPRAAAPVPVSVRICVGAV